MSAAPDESTTQHYQCVPDFEDLYGKIPERISCSSISVTKSDLLTVVQPRTWVCYSSIRAFMVLINQGRIVKLDTSFVTFLRNYIHQRALDTHAYFFRQFFGRKFHEELRRLKNSQAALIPLFNSDVQGKNCNHWGLAVLYKPSATLCVYDSMHGSFMFDNITRHLLRIANSMQSCN